MFFRKPLVHNYQYYDFDSEKNLIRKDPIFTYWWDDIPNFGDWVGPFLLGQISNRPVINRPLAKVVIASSSDLPVQRLS